MIFNENRLLADDSHETSYVIFFFRKLGKMLQNLQSAAVVIGALRIKQMSEQTTKVMICRKSVFSH